MPISVSEVLAGFVPMGFWRRLVATILLLVFIPASIAAGLPLVYCLGADGHRAIELVQNAPHHGARHVRTAVDHSDHGAALEGSDDCVDYKLVTLNGLPQRSSDLKHAVTRLPPAPASIATYREPAIDDGYTSMHLRPSWGYERSVDRLVSHRTTVLRI